MSVEGARDSATLLKTGLSRIEEGLALFRGAGHTQYTIQGIQLNVTMCSALAEAGGRPDREKVLTLCNEGIALAAPMGDGKAVEFFERIKRTL